MPTNSTEAGYLIFTSPWLLETDPDESGVKWPFIVHPTVRSTIFDGIKADDDAALNEAARNAADNNVRAALAIGNAYMAVGGKPLTDRGDGFMEPVEVTEEDEDGSVVTHSVVKVSKFPDWVPTANAPATPAAKTVDGKLPAPNAGAAAPKAKLPGQPSAPAKKMPAPTPPPTDDPIRMTVEAFQVEKKGKGTSVKVVGTIIPEGRKVQWGPYLNWDLIKETWDDTSMFSQEGTWPFNQQGLIAVCSRKEKSPDWPYQVLSFEMEAF